MLGLFENESVPEDKKKGDLPVVPENKTDPEKDGHSGAKPKKTVAKNI